MYERADVQYTGPVNEEHNDVSSPNQTEVSRALDEIVKTGYRELIGLPAEQGAIELINSHPDFEDCSAEELLHMVEVWRAFRRK